jgi:hypothetical protein
MSSIPIDLNYEKLNYLMKKFELHLLTKDEARELIPLLEEEQKEAIKQGNNKYERILSGLLGVLKMYLAGKINLYESIDVSDTVTFTKLSNA